MARARELWQLARLADVAQRQAKTCAHCGVDFGKDYKPKGGRPKRFCGQSCAEAFHAAKGIAATAPRRAARLVERLSRQAQVHPCVVCSSPIVGSIRQTCSRVCHYLLSQSKQIGKPKLQPDFPKVCACGKSFMAHRTSSRLCQRCSLKTGRRIGKALRKARIEGVYCENVDPFKVFTRDHWRCRRCGVETPRSLRGTYDDDAPELDHIVPLAHGGAHTYLNTQCLCRRCNRVKGASVQGQPALPLYGHEEPQAGRKRCRRCRRRLATDLRCMFRSCVKRAYSDIAVSI